MRHLILTLLLTLGLATSVSAELPKAGICELSVYSLYPSGSEKFVSLVRGSSPCGGTIKINDLEGFEASLGYIIT